MFLPSIINRLLEERRASKVSLQEYTGLSKGGLYNILNGISSPTADNLEKIADFFGVSIDLFFERKIKPLGLEWKKEELINKEPLSVPASLKEYKKEITYLKELLAAKEETLAAKEETIQEMKTHIRDKNEIIILLKK